MYAPYVKNEYELFHFRPSVKQRVNGPTLTLTLAATSRTDSMAVRC